MVFRKNCKVTMEQPGELVQNVENLTFCVLKYFILEAPGTSTFVRPCAKTPLKCIS